MPKVIKFSLPVNNKRVRFLSDLKDNFVVDEVIDLYRSQTLQHWLACRGYTKELEQVKALKSDDDRSLVLGLTKIFGVSLGNVDIDIVLRSLNFQKTMQSTNGHYDTLSAKLSDITNDRKQQYYKLIEDIIQHKDSLEQIRGFLQVIVDKYFDLFSLNFLSFYSQVRDAAPLAMIAVLMNERTRGFFLRSDPSAESNTDITRYDYWGFNYILEKINEKVSEYSEDFVKCVKECRGDTDGYWKDLESKDTKCMLLSCYSDCYVRDAGKVGGDKSGRDANQKYQIFDGLDYKGNSSSYVRYVVI